MANSAAFARIKADILALVSRIPAGYVSTHSDVGRHLAVQARHVAYILATLDEMERETTPWWRVVADGGAIGRHKRRDDQIAKLKLDGVPLSGAAIVQEMADRKVKNLADPPAVALRRAPGPGGSPASRSRGTKSHP